MCILNKKATKDYALKVAQENRGGRFTRVSESFINRIDAQTRLAIEREIHQHPSKGVTLK